MKKITLILFAFLLCWQVNAQVSGYSFAQTAGTYTEITGGTVLGTATNDDTSFNANPIGFSFAYNGILYTQFGVNSNGFLAFGAATVGSSYTSLSTGSANNVIAALNGDLQGNAVTGELSYQLSGTAPNQVLTVQWKSYRAWNAIGDENNFQIKLYQTTNLVQVVYGAFTQNATDRTRQVGLRGASNTDFRNRTTATDWLTTTSGVANSDSCALKAAIVPASGLTFTWTPQTCFSPSGLVASAITGSTATITWTTPLTVPSTGYEYFYTTSTGAPTVAGTPVTGLTADLTGLSGSSTYNVWLRSNCGSGNFSVWAGPFQFNTTCGTVTSLNEGFESTTGVIFPNCWAKVGTNGSAYPQSSTGITGAKNLYMFTSAAASPAIVRMPTVSNASAGTHRMNMKVRANETIGETVQLGYLTTPTDATSFVVISSIVTNSSTVPQNFITIPSGLPAGDIVFALRTIATVATSVLIDDVKWEPIPTVLPGCTGPVTSVTNVTCGNFATALSWTAVAGADGYKISIGTGANGQNLVVTNQDLNSQLSYSFVGNPATQYYYTVKPYNNIGDAVGCTEGTFTTFGNGCYCTAVPTDIDNAGVTNVQVGTANYPVTAVTYANLTTQIAADITRGVNTVMNVTLGTGYGYFTNVWVDFNDNFTFEPSELVKFVDTDALNAVPTVVNTSFVTPVGAPLGLHRMRIVTTDGLQTPANPCYGGAYGVVVDLLVNVLPAPACLPPSASTTSNITSSSAVITWVSAGTKFNVDYGFTADGQGNGIFIDGVLANTITLPNLDAQANYSYYIQTDCGGGSLSPWVGPFNFRTGCPSSGDFTQNFTTETTITAPVCWTTLINSTVGGASISVNSFNDYISLSTGSAGAGASLHLVTPALTALPLNTHRIKFKSSGPLGTSLIVGTMTDPGNASTFTAVQTIPLTTSFADYAVSFTNSTTNNYVAFKFVGTATSQTVNIDDVIWETAPTCPDIYLVSVTNVTSNGAALSWTPGGLETAWQYAVGVSTLSGPSSLTPVDVLTTPSTTIPGLLPSTSYKVWVRAKCGNELGQWSPAKTFITACVAVTTFPWTEGFENITPGFNVFPVCWSKENGDFDTSNNTFGNTPRSGANYLRNSWSATNEFMWTPGFTLTAGVSYDFSFYMQGDGYAGWDVNVFQNTSQISTGATQLGGTTTASGPGSTALQPYALVKNTIVPTTTGTYYFSIRVNQPSFAPNYIGFDDFRMEPTPTCVAPLLPTATNVTVSSATINWSATTPAPANGYDYYVTNTTLTPNAATIPTGTVAAGILTANLINLSSSTVYRIYVRSICGANDKSSWSDAGIFTTPCSSFAVPFLQDFSTYVPLCWTTSDAGTVATGPIGTSAGIWSADGFLNSGATGAIKANLYFINRIGWIVSPEMNTTVGTVYKFSFNYGATLWNQTTPTTMGSDDFVKVAMSSNNGVSWTEVFSITAASNITNASQQYNYELTATTSKIKFAFIASDGSVDDTQDYDIFIDNVALEVVLSVADFTKNSFTVYPNPVKDMLNVSFTQDITDVTVFNLLGQQVLFTKINATKGQVDMSNLSSGTYLVKVNSENAVKTIKVIKQ